MVVPVMLFLLGFVLLIKGGDWFVDGATGIAHKFHIPEILIGATVVSIGTTLPEVMVSAGAALSGHGEIAYGNAIGSIICNTSLIAAITVAVRPSEVNRKAMISQVVFFYLSAVIYAAVAYFTGYFSRIVGIVLVGIFVAYMIVSVLQAKKSLSVAKVSESSDSDDTQDCFYKHIVMLVVGAAVIAIGARLLVDNGTIIAEKVGVPESVIALTFVALGTSLPELVTAITSLVKGHGALSLGNIIGANIFNLVLVSGVSTVLSPFPVPNSSQIFNYNTSLLVDIPIMFIVMSILIVPALIKKKLSRAQGIILLAIYAAFCVFQFSM